MANGDKPKRTLGGEQLSRCADSHAEISAKVGIDKSLVTRWTSGARKPTPPQRAKLVELYGIPEDAWESPASSSAPKRAPKAKRNAATPAPSSARGREEVPDAIRLQRFIRDAMRELETSDLPANKRAESLKKLVDAQVALDRSTGENAITLQRIVAHPDFQRVVRLIVDALGPFPEALQAATAALETVRG